MRLQVALKRQQAAEDAIALGLRACIEGAMPILRPGPLWGPGTVSPPEDCAPGGGGGLQRRSPEGGVNGGGGMEEEAGRGMDVQDLDKKSKC